MMWVIVVVAALVVPAAVVYAVGLLTPKDHETGITATFAALPSVVFAAAADFERVPDWFSEVKSVRRIDDVDGQPAYRENYGGFEVTNVVRVFEPDRKIVREILPEGAFSGSWTIELTPADTDTKVTLVERGHVDNPVFRAMMRFKDNRKTLRAYAAALGRRIGAEAVVDVFR
jgi:uncharacterized protein YndB with AHSA1/START domain